MGPLHMSVWLSNPLLTGNEGRGGQLTPKDNCIAVGVNVAMYQNTPLLQLDKKIGLEKFLVTRNTGIISGQLSHKINMLLITKCDHGTLEIVWAQSRSRAFCNTYSQ